MVPPDGKLSRDLRSVLAMARLDPISTTLAAECPDSAAALERLRGSGNLLAAARLVAFALPRREAVWWASRCAVATAPADQPPLERDARLAAERWVWQQDEEARRAAMDVARRAGLTSADAWTAVAAFWSAGSMAPPDQPVVPAAPHLAGTAVIGAVALAAVRDAPARQQHNLVRFLASADDIAAGGGGNIPPDATGVAT